MKIGLDSWSVTHSSAFGLAGIFFLLVSVGPEIRSRIWWNLILFDFLLQINLFDWH